MNHVIISWSGGKDSCLACYKAMANGYTVSYLANTVSNDFRRVRFHGLEARVIQDQARALNIPLLQKETRADAYAKEFKENLARAIPEGIVGVVFGDIHLADCLKWANQVCRDLGVEAIEPLWGRKPEDVLADFMESGFEAVVVSTQAKLLDDTWVGRKLDKSFLHDVTQLTNVDACGENGEYHTLVLDGPLFNQRIDLKKTQKVLRQGYWFLDIQDYALAAKHGAGARA